jgi:hypothetical protein
MASTPTPVAVTPDLGGVESTGTAGTQDAGRLTHAADSTPKDGPHDGADVTSETAAPGDGGEWRTQARKAGVVVETSPQGLCVPAGVVLSEEASYLVEVVKYVTRRKCEGVTVQLLGAQLSPPRSCKGQLVGLVSSRPDVFTVYFNPDSIHPWVKLAQEPQAALQALLAGAGAGGGGHPATREPFAPRQEAAYTDHPADAGQYISPGSGAYDEGRPGGWQTRQGWGVAPVAHREWEPTPEVVAAYTQNRVYVAGGSTLERWALRTHFSKCGPVESVYHAPTEARACFITFTHVAAARQALALGVHTVSGTNGRVVQCRPYVPFRRSGDGPGASRVPHQVPVHAPPPTMAAAQEQAAQAGCMSKGVPQEGSYAAKVKDRGGVVAPDTPGQGDTEQHATVASSTSGSRSAGDTTSEVGSHGRSESLHSAPGGFDAADGEDGSGGMMMAQGPTEGGHQMHAHPHHHHLSADAAPMMVPMMVQGHTMHGQGHPMLMMMNAPVQQQQQQVQPQSSGGIDVHMLSGLMAVLSPGVAAAVKIELQNKGLWPNGNDSQQWNQPQQQRAMYYAQ